MDQKKICVGRSTGLINPKLLFLSKNIPKITFVRSGFAFFKSYIGNSLRIFSQVIFPTNLLGVMILKYIFYLLFVVDEVVRVTCII